MYDQKAPAQASEDVTAQLEGCPATPNVLLLRALWSPLGDIWVILESRVELGGAWGRVEAGGSKP